MITTITGYSPRAAKQIDEHRPRTRIGDKKDTPISIWIQSGDCLLQGPLLRGSRKNGALTHAGISDRAIQARVRFLGEQIDLFDLSPNDCRHYWALKLIFYLS